MYTIEEVEFQDRWDSFVFIEGHKRFIGRFRSWDAAFEAIQLWSKNNRKGGVE